MRWKIQNMKSFLLNLRTKCHDDAKERFVKTNDLQEKIEDSSDSETHSLKRKISRQNQPDAVDETQPLEG